MTHSLEPGGSTPPAGIGAGSGITDPGSKVVWRWRLETSAGDEVTSVEDNPGFPSQSDAESWVGEVWQELADQGVDAVTLFEGDREVYGPMSLHPA
jgi:hypothetical protein